MRRILALKKPDFDTDPGNFLTHVSHKMILYVYYIYRASLRRVYFSTSWDATTVIPIPMPSKDRLLPGNYRSINYSLLSVLLKVFENSVRNSHGSCECVFSDVSILDFHNFRVVTLQQIKKLRRSLILKKIHIQYNICGFRSK